MCLILFLLVGVSGVKAQEWVFHSIDNVEGEKSVRGADGVKLADFNNDGMMDVVSGWEQAGDSRIYINPGFAAVRAPWQEIIVGKASSPEDALAVDLDGDGCIDVVTSSEGPDGGIYFHWAPPREKLSDSEAWKTEILPVSDIGRSWMYTVPMQVDGKHGVDLVSGGKGTPLVWFEAPENPRDTKEWKMHVISNVTSKGGWTMDIHIIDMNNDDDMDIVWTTRWGASKKPADCVGAVRWLENPGNGETQALPWKEHQVSRVIDNFMFADVADLDKDGHLDIIAGLHDKGVRLYRGLSENSDEWQIVELPMGHDLRHCKGVAFGDINLDGQMDVVWTGERARPQHWLEWKNSPWTSENWTKHLMNPTSGKMDAPVLWDVDNDGDLDMLSTMEGKYNVFWFENPLNSSQSMVMAQTPQPAKVEDKEVKASTVSESADTTQSDDKQTNEQPVKWVVAHEDPMTGDWKKNWKQDAESTISTSSEGMTIKAEKGHDVIWFKPVIEGDLRIEYDYLGLGGNINTILLLVQASGKGGEFKEDIFEWADQRNPASYKKYRASMHYISCSYANKQDEVRIRQQPDTGYLGQFEADGMLQPGDQHHIVFERIGINIRFIVKNTKTGKEKIYKAKANPENMVPKGRIGFRHMGMRSARYSNFKVLVPKEDTQ